MRSAWLASAAVHAGAVVWLALAIPREAPAPSRPPSRTIAPRAPVLEGTREPIEVVVLDEVASSEAAPPRAIRTAIAHASTNRTETSTSGEPTAAAPASTTPTAAAPTSSTPTAAAPANRGSSLLAMRRLDLRAPADVLPPGPAPMTPPEQPSGRIAWQHSGSGAIHDLVTTVDVEPDGTAHVHDRGDFHIHLPLPSLQTLRDLPSALKAVPGELHETLRGWYRDLQVQNDYLAHYDRRQHLDEIPNGCEEYAELNCISQDLPAPSRKPEPDLTIEGEADVSAYLQRKFVGDPYASRKKQLLEDTFRERAAHGEAYRADQLVHGAERMHDNLEQLWATTRDAAARRSALFELWDECAEGQGPLGEAGQRARDLVLLWIRTRLPAGGADAYTPDELAALAKRRHSAQAFEPYRVTEASRPME